MNLKLYKFLKLIPEGKVVSYKTLAKIFHIHHRGIARKLSENTKPDEFPCYKVVSHDGKLGGYNLGIKEKVKRLEKDGIIVKKSIVQKEFFWSPTKEDLDEINPI